MRSPTPDSVASKLKTPIKPRGSPFPSWREPSKKKGSRLPRFGRNRLGSCSKLASQQTIPERRLVSCRAEFSRGERNVWMQRPEAKNPPERPLLSAETGNVENRRQDPRRNGLVSIDDGFRGSGRLDGGAYRDRTCDPLDVNEAL